MSWARLKVERIMTFLPEQCFGRPTSASFGRHGIKSKSPNNVAQSSEAWIDRCPSSNDTRTGGRHAQ